MRNIPRSILTALRQIRRARRRILGRATPHWAADTYKAIKIFNFVELLPTLTVLFFAPRHFFRRLEPIVGVRKSGCKSVYKSPIGFALRTAVLITIVLNERFMKVFLASGLGHVPGFVASLTKLRLLVGALLFALPLLIPILCGFMILLVWLVILGAQTKIDESASKYAGQAIQFFSIPLSFGSYRDQRWKCLGWSSLYFLGYLITLPIFALLAFAALLRILLHKYPNILSFDGLPINLRIWSLVGLVALFVFSRIVIHPYVAMLMECRKSLTDEMLRFNSWPLKSAIEGYFALCKIQKNMEGKTSRWANWSRTTTSRRKPKAVERIRLEWKNFERWFRGEMARKRVPPAYWPLEKRRALSSLSLKLTPAAKGVVGRGHVSTDVIAQIAFEALPPEEQAKYE
jgi:hypothetical protein